MKEIKIIGILVCILMFASTITTSARITTKQKMLINKDKDSCLITDTDTIYPPWDYSGWHDEGSEVGGGHDYKWSLGPHCNYGEANAWSFGLGKAYQEVRLFHTCEIGDCYKTPYNCNYDFGFHYSYDGDYECEVINLHPGSDGQVYDKIKILFKLEWMEGDEVKSETKTEIIHEDTSKNTNNIDLIDSDVYYIGDVSLPAGKNIRISADLYLFVSVSAIGIVETSGTIKLEGCLDKITIEYDPPNRPPNKPDTPSGPTSGDAGTSYTYSTSTTDPDGNTVSYYWDWGDGTNSGWTGSSVSHTWNEEGTYSIKVKAKDSHGAESDWSDYLSVSMPKNKARSFPDLFETIKARVSEILTIFKQNSNYLMKMR